jgi:hypothetical protein
MLWIELVFNVFIDILGFLCYIGTIRAPTGGSWRAADIAIAIGG